MQAGAARVVVLDPDRRELGRLECAGSSPVVTINFPAGGETLAGTQTLQWTIDDALSSSHTSAVQYCPVGEAELRLRSRRRR